jgi:uncharacterized LabA/DUF88 family protein
MKIIYLIDGGFFCRKFTQVFKRYPSSGDVINFVSELNKKYNGDREYLRIYYYDCYPLGKQIEYPISKRKYNLDKTQRYKEGNNLLNSLKREDFVSVREGVLIYQGWKSKITVPKKILSEQQITDDDFKPDIVQKGVDIKIGLDIAWISLGRIAERIILITSDSDFVPAMKFARRSGIQVFYCSLGHGGVDNLKDNSDVNILVDLATIMR